MKKIMDFCGSGELLLTMLSGSMFYEPLSSDVAGRKVTMMIFAEDDKTTMQGNDLSVQVEDDLRFGEAMESLDGRNEPEYQPKFGPDKDGWIEWRGGQCPVKSGTRVDIKYRSGDLMVSASPELERWWHGFSPQPIDIVAYMILDEEEQA